MDLTYLESILKLVENYGLALVLLILVSMMIYKVLNKLFDTLYPRFLNLIDKSMGVSTGDKKRLATADIMRRDIIINRLLEDLKDATKADRAYLYKYHNGGKSIDGLDYIRCSNTNEVVKPGIKPSINISQGLPVGIFCSWNRHFLNHTMLNYNEGDSEYATYCVDRGTKSTFALGIYDLNELLMGFIGVDYYEHIDYDTFKSLGCHKKLYSTADKLSIMMIHNPKLDTSSNPDGLNYNHDQKI